MTHICVGKLTIIDSVNGLSPGRRQAIIWISVGVLLIGPLGTNFSEIFIEIQAFSFAKMHLKTSSGKWPPSCLDLNVLTISNIIGIMVLFLRITPTCLLFASPKHHRTCGHIKDETAKESWWCHQMETFPALLALCEENSLVAGQFSSQRPVMLSFDVSFDLSLNKRLSKPSRCRWFETPWSPLWRHRYENSA